MNFACGVTLFGNLILTGSFRLLGGQEKTKNYIFALAVETFLPSSPRFWRIYHVRTTVDFQGGHLIEKCVGGYWWRETCFLFSCIVFVYMVRCECFFFFHFFQVSKIICDLAFFANSVCGEFYGSCNNSFN